MKRTFAGLLGSALMVLASAAFAACGPSVNAVPALGVTDAVGASQVNISGCKASYFAGLGANTPAATPTDIAFLTGSATKTIMVTHARLTVQATAAGLIQYALVKRSAGTQTVADTPFLVGTHGGPMDSADAASTVLTAAQAGVYTTNRTNGTLIGIVDEWTVTMPANGTVVFTYDCQRPAKCITLRGVTQILAFNGASHTLLSGEIFGVSFEWTEE